MALLVQTPRGTVALPPQGFFQQQPSPFASQLTPRGIPFVPAQSRAPRLIPTAIAPPIPAPAAPVFAAPPLLAPVRQHDDFGFDPDPDDFFSDPLTDDAAFGPGSETSIAGTIGGLLGGVADFVGDKVTEAVENPVRTAADFAFGFVPVAGQINALSGLFGGPTVGKTVFGEDGLFGGDGPAGGEGPGSTSGTSGTGGGHSFGDPDDTDYDDTSESGPPGGPSGPGGIGSVADNAANIGMEDEAEDADASDGDGDGSFICTAAWDTGISAPATWKNNKRMYAWVRKNDPDTYAGYKKFGPWVAKRVRAGRWQWAAKIYPQSWAYEIALRTGKDTSDFPLWVKIENRLQRIFLRPIVRLWGKS